MAPAPVRMDTSRRHRPAEKRIACEPLRQDGVRAEWEAGSTAEPHSESEGTGRLLRGTAMVVEGTHARMTST